MRKLKYLVLLVLIAAMLISCGGREDASIFQEESSDSSSVSEIQNEEPEIPEEDLTLYKEYTDIWIENYSNNEDYIGMIRFDSGIINLPIVQGETNDTYLRTNWETMEYDVYGSIFLDYRNSLDDQNLIIYGHFSYPNMDPERVIMFTPLEKLTDVENYEENSEFEILLKDQVRRYKVVYVYYCPIYTDATGFQYTAGNTQFYRTYYDSEYLKEYSDAASELALYDTGMTIEAGDKMVTLQTCVNSREDLRLIVVAKEMECIRWDIF